jgi:crotonobetainyl-CoA:carnitine CoA-transferase CaiB-like acyl-CoA transferase
MEEWVDVLLEVGIPAGPIYDYEQALDNEHANFRHVSMEIDHPVEGKVKSIGFPVKMSGTPQQVRLPPPLLGQHNAELLAELGVSQSEVEAMEQAGAFAA